MGARIMIISGALLFLLVSAVTKNDAAQVVRLVDGDGQCSGRVEVYHNGQWGTVCDDRWGMNNAEVVCREVGCGRALDAIGSAHSGTGSGPIWMDDVTCSGSESSLKQCRHTGFGVHNCIHFEDAAVVCSEVRLVGGDDQCSGRVEVYHDGQWGTVCDDHWDWINANVVCREVGCGVSEFIPWLASFGLAQGPIWLDDVSCSGSESSLTECQHSGFGSHDCSHKEDAAVVCNPHAIRLVDGKNRCSGEVEMDIKGQWTKVPSRILDIVDPSHICAMVGCGAALVPSDRAEWPDHRENVEVICSAQVVRLVDGDDECSGRVEVYHHSSWGSVCADHWDMRDAEVVCGELNCGAALAAPGGAHFGKGSGEIWLGDVRCSGNESSLMQCQRSGFGEHNCRHDKDAAVVCSARAIRLVDGDDQCSGRVEVFHKGRWGTVCDDHWGRNNAMVVCREVGCGEALDAYREAHYGQGSGPIWLDDVICSGNESSLTECQHSGFGVHNCDHEEDAAVYCLGV